MTVQRYTWENAVVDAQAAGHLTNGALMVCLKLARAINWSPQDGRQAGLYWKNDDAFKAVGMGRTSYYDHREELFGKGFFKLEKQNLIPQVPDLSALGTEQSAVRTDESAVRTTESAVRNPFSEDTLSDDVLSEDSLSEDAPVVADAPTVSFDKVELGKDRYLYTFRDIEPLSNRESTAPVYFVDLDGVTKSPQPQIGTEEKPEGAIKRVDYESAYTCGGWLYRTKNEARAAKQPIYAGDDW